DHSDANEFHSRWHRAHCEWTRALVPASSTTFRGPNVQNFASRSRDSSVRNPVYAGSYAARSKSRPKASRQRHSCAHRAVPGGLRRFYRHPLPAKSAHLLPTKAVPGRAPRCASCMQVAVCSKPTRMCGHSGSAYPAEFKRGRLIRRRDCRVCMTQEANKREVTSHRSVGNSRAEGLRTRDHNETHSACACSYVARARAVSEGQTVQFDVTKGPKGLQA